MPESHSHDREFFRAPARLSVRYGPDTPEGRRAMSMDQSLWQTQSQLEEAARAVKENRNISDSLLPLLDVLRWLDFKVDMVLHHLRQREHDQHFPHRLETFDISGSGLGVASHGALALGQKLILAISLPNRPWRPIYARGEVVRDKQDAHGQPRFGVRFSHIPEADQERLVRFTFEQQRRQLARRNQEADDQ